uniref:Uncharacterized protein n=1 Tax=Anguilla anguilla TaxID=7936 RepID=A0A0E9WER8_ANGAN
MDGADLAAIKQLVFAGFPTTRTLTVFLAYLSRAAPWDLKMATLALSRSFLSMPSFLGMEPTRMAASRSLNATSSLSVGITSLRSGRAQS